MRKSERDRLTDPDGRSLSYQSRSPALARRMARACRRSIRDIQQDIDAILTDLQYRGGFKTRAEAVRWMDTALTPGIIARLLRMTERIRDPVRREQAVARVMKESARGHLTIKRAIQTSIRINAVAMAGRIIKESAPVLRAVSKEAFLRQSFTLQKQVGVGWSLGDIPVNQLHQTATSRLEFTSDWMARSVSEQVREDVMEGLMKGSPVDEIARSIARSTPELASKSMATARTILTEVSNLAERQALKDAGIERYEYVATLDERTCPVCGGLDGQVFELSEAKAGVNLPPMHPNCRCVHIAALSDEVKGSLERAARDEDGKYIRVPRTMSYEQWKDRFA